MGFWDDVENTETKAMTVTPPQRAKTTSPSVSGNFWDDVKKTESMSRQSIPNTVAGFNTVGVMSKNSIHMGTHNEPGTFDITASEVAKRKMSLRDAANKLAAEGYIVAIRKAGQRGISSDHLHIANPDMSPVEARRLRSQIPTGFIVTPAMVKARQGQEAIEKANPRRYMEMPTTREITATVKSKTPGYLLNVAKSAGIVASGVAQSGIKALATLGEGAEPGYASPQAKAATNAALKPSKSSVGKWIDDATTPYTKQELLDMVPYPRGDMRKSLGTIVDSVYQGFATLPEQAKTGDFAPLLNSVLMAAGAIKGGRGLARMRSPKIAELVKYAADESRAGNKAKALPAWENVIDLIETQEHGRIVWKSPEERANVINVLASAARKPLPEPRPAKLGEPIVTTPPEGTVPVAVDKGYVAPPADAVPIPFQRIPEITKGARVNFVQPAGVTEAGEFVVKTGSKNAITLKNAVTGQVIKTSPAKLRLAEPIPAPAPVEVARQPVLTKVATEPVVAKRAWDMTPNELDNAVEVQRSIEKNAPAMVFGEEGAKAYNSAQKVINSSTSDFYSQRYKDASALISKMEKGLTPEQERILFGIGETGPTLEELKAFQDAIGSIDYESPIAMGRSLRFALTQLESGKTPEQMGFKGQIAYTQLKHAFSEAQKMGWDTQEISDAAIRAAADRFKDPADAALMLQDFLKPKSPVEAARQPLAAKPTTTEPFSAKEAIPSATEGAKETIPDLAAKYAPEQDVAGIGESGKAKIDTLMKAAGYGGSALALYTLAKKLQTDPKTREDTLETKARQFGEGGFISKAFDVMAAGSYLATAIEMESVLPGKQGIGKLFKNRAQWSDVSALGILPDIAFDPLNFISYGKIFGAASKPLKYVAVKSGLSGTLGAAAKTIAETGTMRKALDFFEFELLGGMGSIRSATVNARKYLDRKMDSFITNHAVWMEGVEPLRKHIVAMGRKFGPDFDKDVARVVEEGWETSARGTTLSFDEARRAVHNQKVQLLRELEQKKGLPYAKEVRDAAEQVMELENKSADLLVDAGQLSREVADKWNNVHLRRMYERFDDVDNYLDALAKSDPLKARKLRSSWEMFKKTYKTSSNRLDLSATTMRQELPEEIRNILKEIPFASVRLLKGQSVAADLAFKAKTYSEIASEVALTEEQVAKLGGRVKDYMFLDPDEVLSIGKEMGKIPASKYFGDLAGKWIPQAIFYDLMNSLPIDKSTVAKFAAKATTAWKMGKVPLSIVTSMRNFYTNIILADVLGKTSPYRLDLYYKALRSLATKDDTYKEAKAAGTFLTDTFTHSELENAMREAAQDPYSKMEKIKGALRWIAEKPSQVYNANEQWFKMTVYQAAKERGLNPEKAADFADRALFNYRKVPRGIDVMRRHGFMPFIVFPFKAIPATFKAFWQDTGRLSKYPKIANAIDQRTPEDVKARERTVLPSWMNDSVRLPGKDARYFDVEYLLPYGGVNDYFDTRWVNNINPAAGTVSDMLHNQNMFTGKAIADEGLPKAERARQYMEYALKAALPSMTPGVGSVSSALEQLHEPGQKSYLNNKQIAYMFGLKTTLLDTDKSASIMAYQLRKAHQQMTSGIRRIVERNRVTEYTDVDDLKSQLPANEARLIEGYISEFMKKSEEAQRKLERYNR